MRKINLRLLASSVKPGVVGDGGEVAIAGDPEQKGASKLAHHQAPLDALLRQIDVNVEAHLPGLF
jgi:hypothetical protein